MEIFDFITLDFETANSNKESICQIGITTVKGGKIKDVKSWLIDPETTRFDDFNIRIHQITPLSVKGKPTFKEIWPEILTYIDYGEKSNIIFAHNAQFDIKALEAALYRYQLPIPHILFGCSLAISRRTWSGEPSYSLESLCRKFNIQPGAHHAGEDSRACAEIMLLACAEKGVDLTKDTESEEELKNIEDRFQIYLGELSEKGYLSCICQRLSKSNSKSNRIKKIIGDESKFDSDSIFYQRNVVFTGTLSSMKRAEAQQIIADIGGINQNGVNRETNFLIVGQQDYRIVGEDGMSSKQEKALKLIEKGASLEILSEDDFLRSI